MKRVKVLIAMQSLDGGGIERVVLDLARGLDPERFQVTLFVHEKRGQLAAHVDRSLELRFHSQEPYRRTRLPALLHATLRHAREADVLIGGSEGRASFLMLLASQILRKPIACWLHFDWREYSKITSWRQLLSLHAYRRADAVVACSQGVADSFASMVPIRPGKLHAIHNGIDSARVRALAREPVSGAHEALFAQPTVLTVGRLDYQKGHEFLVEAHAELLAQGLSHHLLIVGEGPLFAERQAQVRKLGVERSVHFLGFQSNPYALMRRATVFALSSRFEGLAVVLLEALSLGAPVVSADCPSGPREVLDGCGLLVPREDSHALAEGLGRMLRNHGERERFSQLGMERSRRYELQQFAGNWAHVLGALAAA